MPEATWWISRKVSQADLAAFLLRVLPVSPCRSLSARHQTALLEQNWETITSEARKIILEYLGVSVPMWEYVLILMFLPFSACPHFLDTVTSLKQEFIFEVWFSSAQQSELIKKEGACVLWGMQRNVCSAHLRSIDLSIDYSAVLILYLTKKRVNGVSSQHIPPQRFFLL